MLPGHAIASVRSGGSRCERRIDARSPDGVGRGRRAGHEHEHSPRTCRGGPGRRPRLTARRCDRGQDRCDGHSRGDRQLADPRPRSPTTRHSASAIPPRAAPCCVDDHTRIGSVTKTFTGTAILQLVDQGKIRLSDPISRYVDGVPSGDVITLDLLGRMRSGLPDYTETDTFLPRASTASCRPVPTRSPRHRKSSSTRRSGGRWTSRRARKYKYSNTNTMLLGMVIKKVDRYIGRGLPPAEHLRAAGSGGDQLSGRTGWLPGAVRARLQQGTKGQSLGRDAVESVVGAVPRAGSCRRSAGSEDLGGGAGQGHAAAAPTTQERRVAEGTGGRAMAWTTISRSSMSTGGSATTATSPAIRR